MVLEDITNEGRHGCRVLHRHCVMIDADNGAIDDEKENDSLVEHKKMMKKS